MSPRQKKSLAMIARTNATIKRKKPVLTVDRKWLEELESRLNRYYRPGSQEAMAMRLMMQ